MLINAINIGEVKTPIIEKIIPITPARYSCLEIDSIAKIKARGLNIGDKIKTPTNPKIILSVPYCGTDSLIIILSLSIMYIIYNVFFYRKIV
tara:strand:- start:345 stop:620 length:276 start_codon:yes stop_codon:yes gene_type:complete